MKFESGHHKMASSTLRIWMSGLLIVGVFLGSSMIPVAGYAQSTCESDHSVIGKRTLDTATNTVVVGMDDECQMIDDVDEAVDIQLSRSESIRSPGTTSLISRSPDNQQFSVGALNPAVSATGRYVTFNTFIPGTPEGQVYVRDQSTNRTELISVNADGQPGNGISDLARTTPDGRYVVFSSLADNLVPDDTNGAGDIFLYDRQRNSVERVNVASDGTESNGFSTLYPSVSTDGRYVVFNTDADNLAPNDFNLSEDVFLRDRVRGTTERISTAQDGSAAGGVAVSMSPDGRYIAYISSSGDLVANDTNGARDAFVYDRRTQRTELVSIASDGTQAEVPPRVSPLTLVFDAEISPDGRYVVFSSKADNLVANDTNGQTDVFVHDRTRRTTERVSLASDGSEGNAASAYAALSFGGRYVVFHSSADNLVTNDTNGQTDVFVHDRTQRTTKRVSVAADGTGGNRASGLITQREDTFFFIISEPGIDWLGRTTAFESSASNLVPDDTNEQADIFVARLR